MQDQAGGLRQLAQKARIEKTVPKKARTIVITSGKGGVGKSTFSLNFAIALRQNGYRVGILDADLGLANLDLMMGIRAPFNIEHLVFGDKSLEEIILKGPGGIVLIPGGSGLVSMADMDEFKLEVLVNSLAILDSYLDYLIIDTGAGISKQVLAFALAADEVMTLTTPEPTSLADSFGIIKVIDHANPSIPLSIIINQADNFRHGELVYKRLNLICQRYIKRDIKLNGIITYDIATSRAIRNQVPLLIYQPNSNAASAIKKAAFDYLKASDKVAADDHFGKGLRGLMEKMAKLLR